MRKFMIPFAVAATVGAAAPALASDLTFERRTVTQVVDQGGSIPVQVAVDIANGVGLISVSNTNMWGTQWQVEGYDAAGRYMEVDIDARTGAIVNVDR